MHELLSELKLEVTIEGIRMKGMEEKRGERWDLRDLAPLESLFYIGQNPEDGVKTLIPYPIGRDLPL